MNRLKRFLEQGAIAYAGIVEYIPCPVGKVFQMINYERSREGNQRCFNYY